MSTQEDISTEIARIKREINAQKVLIRRNVKNKLVFETAETEMKALHTRLSTLEANLVKCS